jgi:hypothetical protein
MDLRCWRRAEGSKEVGRIMLEFTLLARDSENYNIINWTLTGISIASLEPVEPISEAWIGLSCLIGWR